MKKLKAMLFSAYMMIACLAAAPAMAGSAEFTGIYGALQGSAVGVQFEGSYSDENGRITRGTGGRTVPLAGVEVGVNIPIGKSFFISIGGVKNEMEQS